MIAASQSAIFSLSELYGGSPSQLSASYLYESSHSQLYGGIPSQLYGSSHSQMYGSARLYK